MRARSSTARADAWHGSLSLEKPRHTFIVLGVGGQVTSSGSHQDLHDELNDLSTLLSRPTADEFGDHLVGTHNRGAGLFHAVQRHAVGYFGWRATGISDDLHFESLFEHRQNREDGADIVGHSSNDQLLAAGCTHRTGEGLVVHRVDDAHALDALGEGLRGDVCEFGEQRALYEFFHARCEDDRHLQNPGRLVEQDRVALHGLEWNGPCPAHRTGLVIDQDKCGIAAGETFIAHCFLHKNIGSKNYRRSFNFKSLFLIPDRYS